MTKKESISRRQFFKFSGAALAGGVISAGVGSHVFAQSSVQEFGSVKFGVISDCHMDIKGKNGMKMSR